MSNEQPHISHHTERIILFGTRCNFAERVATKLKTAGYSIDTFISPAPPGISQPIRELDRRSRNAGSLVLPMVRGSEFPTIDSIPTHLQVANLNDTAVIDYLAWVAPDFLIGCCFPRRIPSRLTHVATYGGLNVHPSLLPAYRGPDPLFWMFYKGELTTGVTIHQIDEHLDSGPIVAQERVEFELGTPGDELWDLLADIGGDLLASAVHSISHQQNHPVPQLENGTSYFSWPSIADLHIAPESWRSWRLFHFLRGVTPLGHRPFVRRASRDLRIRAALAYDVDPDPERGKKLEPNAKPHIDAQWLMCADGWVLIQFASG